MSLPASNPSKRPNEMDRGQWWREYAAWHLGKRDGPICIGCGATINNERATSIIAQGRCEECEGGDE